MDEEIQGILEDMRKLQERIDKYLKKQGLDTPYIPPYIPNPIQPINQPSKCGACGIELSEVMCYYCPRPNCPTGLGGPSCVSSISTTEGKPLC